MFLCHTLCAFAFWLVLNKIWPEQRPFTLLAAFLHLNYPGFLLNQVAVTASMYYVVLGCFYLSLYLNLEFLDQPRHRWWILGLGLLCSLVNLTLDEYFFFTELGRPILLYLYLSSRKTSTRGRLKSALYGWLPYLTVYLATILWRMLYQSQITHHSMSLLEDARRALIPTIIQQLRQMAMDIYTSGPKAWLTALHPADILQTQNIPYMYYGLAVLLMAAVLLAIGWWIFSRIQFTASSIRTALVWILFGLVWCILSGWSIWLAKKPIGDYFIVTRFTIPFLPGEVMLIVGLVMLFRRLPWLQLGLAALLVSSTICLQVLVGNSYKQDWARQKSFYYQLYWRFQGIKPGTTFVVTRPPTTQGEENSMSAEWNWFFSPKNPNSEVDFYGYFISEKFFSDNPNFLAGDKVDKGHLIGSFTATQDQLVSLQVDSRNCIRVLYPGVDSLNPHINDLAAHMAEFSHPERVTVPDRADSLAQLQATFGSEPEHNWCWLYQQADLLRQQGDWQKLAALAKDLNPADFKHDWQMLMPFVEGYALSGSPDKASKLLREVNKMQPRDMAVYCQITSTWLTSLNPQAEFLAEIDSGRTRANCPK
jgi:hypothetical protein